MKINISIDDVSPHPLASIKVVEKCNEIISIFPKAKFSLFVPISYWRTIKPGTVTTEPLSIERFPDFCNFISKLPKENFEICYHGLYHGIPGISDNDEFQKLNVEEAQKKFKSMFEIVDEAGLKNVFKPVFRPPAWRMSSDAINVAQQMGIEILALSPKEYAKKIYDGAENTFSKVVYYNCNPPFDALQAFSPYTEIVYHACEWDSNYLSEEKTDELKKFIQSQTDVEFCFMEDLV